MRNTMSIATINATAAALDAVPIKKPEKTQLERLCFLPSKIDKHWFNLKSLNLLNLFRGFVGVLVVNTFL